MAGGEKRSTSVPFFAGLNGAAETTPWLTVNA
jgi:hypothetical protein